jgi:hypothetical protein
MSLELGVRSLELSKNHIKKIKSALRNALLIYLPSKTPNLQPQRGDLFVDSKYE